MSVFANIIASASYVPEKIISNDDLSKILDTSDEWIFQRTGIKNRHISTGENTSDLAIEVAKKLLAESGLSASELDFIIVASMSADYQSPSLACQVQGAIKADQAFATDVSAACSGFVYALALANRLILKEDSKGMVIASDVMSKVVDWSDRSTAVLFGDGAGGVILSSDSKEHFLVSNLYAQGDKAESLLSGYSPVENPWVESSLVNDKLSMDGRDIFNFVTNQVSASLKDLKDDYDIDYYLLHQANARILDHVAKKIKEPRNKFIQNIENYGNTSSASIAILLDEAIKNKTLKLASNQTILLSGFGGGLSYGNILIKL